MKYFLKAALFAMAAVLATPGALADDDAKCAGTAKQGITPDMVIEACTAIIREGGSPLTLAAAYYNRGNAHFDRKEWALAIDDYDHALDLRSNYPTAMFNRGLAKKHAGDNTGGDADIAASKTMKP